MFAGLNLLRAGAMKEWASTDFEFSQNYMMFWDKLERANYFLEAIISTKDRDADDRTVAFLHDQVMGDGGQWNMFVALVAKHGLVPKSCMPETRVLLCDGEDELSPCARSCAREPRRCGSADGTDAEAAVRSRSCSQPPTGSWPSTSARRPSRFTWQWTDKDKDFHRDADDDPAASSPRST